MYQTNKNAVVLEDELWQGFYGREFLTGIP